MLTEEQEREYWKRLLDEIQDAGFPMVKVAEVVKAEIRSVWWWKAGKRSPRGLRAVRLYLLHVKLCTNEQCPNGPIARTA